MPLPYCENHVVRRGTGIGKIGGNMIGSVRHTRRRVQVVLMAGLALAGMALALAPAAAAAIPSKTTVTASPSSATLGTTVTLTAKVSDAIVGGILITPSGPVSFSYTNANGNGSLGSATLSSCLLSACTARLSTNSLPPGTSTVSAVYNGDGLSGPSSGTTTVTMTAPIVIGNRSTVTCNAGAFCETGKVTAPNGSNTMDVLSTPSASQQTVTALLETGKNLHCPQNTDNQTGALGTFSVSVNDTTKTVTYTGNGSVARSMLTNYNAHPDYVGCFGSPTPFNGYVYGVYGAAAFVSSDGLYEAQLSNCSLHGGALPCVTVTSTSKTTTYTVSTPFGDPPKIIG